MSHYDNLTACLFYGPARLNLAQARAAIHMMYDDSQVDRNWKIKAEIQYLKNNNKNIEKALAKTLDQVESRQMLSCLNASMAKDKLEKKQKLKQKKLKTKMQVELKVMPPTKKTKGGIYYQEAKKRFNKASSRK